MAEKRKAFEFYPSDRDVIFPSLYGWSGLIGGPGIPNEFFETLKYAAEAGDDRLLAIICALIIEDAIDNFLAEVMPRYNRLKDKRDFTFSIKIDVARALMLIPSHLFDKADLVRLIRNDFSHDLSIASFEKLKQERIQTLRQYYTSITTKGFRITAEGDAGLFQELAFSTAADIRHFTLHVNQLSSYIWDNSFLEKLHHFVLTNGDPAYEIKVLNELTNHEERIAVWKAIWESLHGQPLSEAQINHLESREDFSWYVRYPEEALECIKKGLARIGIDGIEMSVRLVQGWTFH